MLTFLFCVDIPVTNNCRSLYQKPALWSSYSDQMLNKWTSEM